MGGRQIAGAARSPSSTYFAASEGRHSMVISCAGPAARMPRIWTCVRVLRSHPQPAIVGLVEAVARRALVAEFTPVVETGAVLPRQNEAGVLAMEVPVRHQFSDPRPAALQRQAAIGFMCQLYEPSRRGKCSIAEQCLAQQRTALDRAVVVAAFQRQARAAAERRARRTACRNGGGDRQLDGQSGRTRERPILHNSCIR